MNADTATPPSATQLVDGEAEVPQQVPRSIIAEPPFEVIVTPIVAVVFVTDAEVGVVIVGTVKVVNELSAE